MLATANLDSISFERSTHQRSSRSRDFVKPRMIARPAVLSTVASDHACAVPAACEDTSSASAGTDSAEMAQNKHDGLPQVDHAACSKDAHECSLADSGAEQDAALLQWLRSLQLRYFTPQEVANLHSFPASFTFPEGVTRKQQYALLGNSLSVAVVSDLLTYLVV